MVKRLMKHSCPCAPGYKEENSEILRSIVQMCAGANQFWPFKGVGFGSYWIKHEFTRV